MSHSTGGGYPDLDTITNCLSIQPVSYILQLLNCTVRTTYENKINFGVNSRIQFRICVFYIRFGNLNLFSNTFGSVKEEGPVLLPELFPDSEIVTPFRLTPGRRPAA